jgi:hypothetical protein
MFRRTKGKEGQRMRHLTRIVLLGFTILLALTFQVQATIVELSVSTDKPVYQLGEDVIISVTAYNPNPEPVTLTGGFYFASYVIDGVYDWVEGRSGPQVIEYETINSGESHTWILTHGFWEMQDYPLEIGAHTISGKVLAIEIIEDNQSPSIEIEVVPEPTTIIFLFAGLTTIRFIARRKSKSC